MHPAFFIIFSVSSSIVSTRLLHKNLISSFLSITFLHKSIVHFLFKVNVSVIKTKYFIFKSLTTNSISLTTFSVVLALIPLPQTLPALQNMHLYGQPLEDIIVAKGFPLVNGIVYF